MLIIFLISETVKKKFCKEWGVGGGGHWLVRMEWPPAGWSVCLLC